LKKCVVASNRVACCTLEIEKFEHEIRHIEGTANTVADILFHNLPNSSATSNTNLKQRDQIIVYDIDMNTDSSVKRELNQAILQNTDPRLQAIKGD
jgi:hypothetical protein